MDFHGAFYPFLKLKSSGLHSLQLHGKVRSVQNFFLLYFMEDRKP